MNLSLLHVLSAQQRAQQKDLQEFTATLEREAFPSPRLEKGPIILLNACVLLYLITHGPVFLYNILHILEKSCVRQMSPHFKLICMSLNNIALNMYFSSNFFVYCGADKRFRARLLSVCTGSSSSTSHRASHCSDDMHSVRRQSRFSNRSNVRLSIALPDDLVLPAGLSTVP